MAIPRQGYIFIDNQQIAFNVFQNFEDNGFAVDNDGYALYNGKRFYYNGTLVLGTDEPIDTEHYWTIIDLTGYTWVGNDQLTSQLNNQYNISFISNNNNFTYIKSAAVIISGETMHILYYNEQPIYSYNDIQWVNNTYKTIQITGGTDATNASLIAWLEANGTLTPPTPPQPSTTNNIFFGNSSIDKIYFGTSEVSKIYYGNTLIYEVSGGSGN